MESPGDVGEASQLSGAFLQLSESVTARGLVWVDSVQCGGH